MIVIDGVAYMPVASARIYKCTLCQGKNLNCHACGGQGVRKVCSSNECREYGCSGEAGGCYVDDKEKEAYQLTKKNK